MFFPILLTGALIPIMVLCFFIYIMDTHKEPFGMLLKLFIFGFISCIPVLICEQIAGLIFPVDGVKNVLIVFVSIFFSVALIEEGFKWLVVRLFAFNSKEFDEIYDIIVYSVFASLGFACIENLLYVFLNGGISTAIFRALLAVPGHACDGVAMGYFFSRAKIAKISGSNEKYYLNIFLSILVPTLFHTVYDGFLFTYINSEELFYLVLFFVSYINEVILCITIVILVSRIQQNLNKNLSSGAIAQSNNGHIYYKSNGDVHFCPLCGRNVEGYNYCPSCCLKLK